MGDVEPDRAAAPDGFRRAGTGVVDRRSVKVDERS
jgi:hypothetical protein